jgi:hypothetical protein
MGTNQLERVARAIVRRFIIDMDRLGQYEFEGRTLEDEVELRWQWWISEAQAAIDAMREPLPEPLAGNGHGEG